MPEVGRIGLPAERIAGVEIGAHSLLVASLSILMGFQSILFALFTKTFATSVGLVPPDPRLDRFYDFATLERGLALGAGALVAGLVLIGVAAVHWKNTGFGPLDYRETMRWVIPGVTLAALGFQTVLSGFFVSILGMNRR